MCNIKLLRNNDYRNNEYASQIRNMLHLLIRIFCCISVSLITFIKKRLIVLFLQTSWWPISESTQRAVKKTPKPQSKEYALFAEAQLMQCYYSDLTLLITSAKEGGCFHRHLFVDRITQKRTIFTEFDRKAVHEPRKKP